MASRVRQYLFRATEGVITGAVGAYVMTLEGPVWWVGAGLLALGTYKVLTHE